MGFFIEAVYWSCHCLARHPRPGDLRRDGRDGGVDDEAFIAGGRDGGVGVEVCLRMRASQDGLLH